MTNILQPTYCQTQCYKQPFVQLWNEDCLETLKRLPDGSVDMLLQDTPFGVTKNEWDKEPDLNTMWIEWLRVTKKNAAIIFFATQPFASKLIVSKSDLFRYDIIWEKAQPVGFLNAKKMPLRSHEIILVFYKSLPIYNPQKTTGHVRKVASAKNRASAIERTNELESYTYGKQYSDKVLTYDSTERYPRSVIRFPLDKQKLAIHPTQKPVDLFRWLIRTYTNEGETVFDGYSGSGTTAVACTIENRKFIGAELSNEYFEKSVNRLQT